MTAAEQCRLETGLTLAEAARRIGKSRRALYDWHRDSPERFAAALKEARSIMDTNNDLLAFVVTADGCEASILVFATKPSAAKVLARGTPWLCDHEWIELKCCRKPSVDKYADQFGAGAIECNNKAEQRVLRELGWYEIDGPLDECIECGLYEWTDLPESELHDSVDGDPICAGCKESSALKEAKDV